MKNISLKNYQTDALRDVLENLEKAARRWHEDGDRHSFSLTAPTGSGKTVIAAAVFEALFYGSDEFDFPADPGAVVLWFSDDPALNEQTRASLRNVSDKIGPQDLRVIKGGSFNIEKFNPKTVYFINRDKLKEDGILSRGHDFTVDKTGTQPMIDAVDYTFWDTLTNTIEDPNLTLYLVLDEAHRGMKRRTKRDEADKETIIRRLINGHGTVPATPIVWGISATVERFNEAMKEAERFTAMPNVVVDSAAVQESGLLKDVIALDIPKNSGPFDTVLTRRAAETAMEVSRAWKDYLAASNEPQDAVKPLLVFQVPNTPDHDQIGAALDTIYNTWADLEPGSVAHVFGEHTDQTFGTHIVPYIEPQRVQDQQWIRVLVAKDAISTGWDCPRAEVLLSYRAAKEYVHIKQLIGRLLRTPLARRIPGNDLLNSVTAILPFHDEKTVTAIANELMTGSDGEPMPERRILINPVRMERSPELPPSLWKTIGTLPSELIPRTSKRPIPRFTRLAHELTVDEIVARGGEAAKKELHAIFDAARNRHRTDLERAVSKVNTVEGRTLKAHLGTKELSFEDFTTEADVAVINDFFERARRAFSPDVALSYAAVLAEQSAADDEEEKLLEAHAIIGAMVLVPEIGEYVDDEATKMANRWLDVYRVAIRALGDDRQDIYDGLRASTRDPLPVDMKPPTSRLEPTVERDSDGNETPLPTQTGHILSDTDGNYPFVPGSSWETRVIDKELGRKETIGWYRNPGTPSPDSLGISYRSGGHHRILRPDFLFFTEKADGSIGVSIVDPHGTHLQDALPKLQGLASYAEEHGDHFLRIEPVAEIDGKLRYLDLTIEAVRADVIDAAPDTNVEGLFREIGTEY